MNPASTLRLRAGIATVFAAWAIFAIGASVASLRVAEGELFHPFCDTMVAGKALVLCLAPMFESDELEVGDRLLELNGEPYPSARHHYRDEMRAGVPNTYTIEKPDGRRLDLELLPVPGEWTLKPSTVLLQVLLTLGAAIYLITGGAVWWLRPERSEAWALLLFCCTMGAQLAMTVRLDFLAWAWDRQVISVPLIGATTFHLFTTYPIEPHWIVRHRRLQLVPYGAAALIVLIMFFESRLGLPSGTGFDLAFLFTLMLVAASVAIVGFERRRHGDGPLKDRADLMFLAAGVSFLPIVGVFAAEWVLQQPFPYYLSMLTAFVFPVAVGYGIVRGQLFEIRTAAKSSAAYGAATLAITGAFALAITSADALIERIGTRFRWFEVSFLFLAILVFNPLRTRMQTLVDRFFDRDRMTYRVAVREISEAMVSMLSLNEIADRILIALTDTMGVDRAMVLLVDDDARALRPVAWRGEWDGEARDFSIPSGHAVWRQLWLRREDLSRSDFDDELDVETREVCRDVYDSLEMEILVPILYGVDLLGVIGMGRKISGDRIVSDDRTLLRTLANQSAIAIENAKAFDEIAKLNENLETRVEERTNELRETQAQLVQAEKMKSLGQLVAGVAHELNNPIGFVHANLQLLDEFIKKLIEGQRTESDTQQVREAIEKLLSRSREGTERVKKIVQDLRTFSRMDQAELQDADLHEELDRTLTLMEPRFKAGIEVERRYGDLPRVRCYPGQLNQVFLNLLMNACDALEGGGKIRIVTRPTAHGVRLEFHDDGPGISEDLRRRIFDPFFTTKSVGAGTGLGLSLSHGIVERHGGRIWVESVPDRGTTFVIELPRVAQSPDEEAD